MDVKTVKWNMDWEFNNKGIKLKPPEIIDESY